MTTILVINGVSSLLAAAGICALLLQQEVKARRKTAARVLYVTSATQPLPRR
ncbi:MAG: hypothetical protein JO372_04680 [Solirubrobacterales bacterium]|nr:hypothetical protein [Solirubrobacterales bacterium]